MGAYRINPNSTGFQLDESDRGVVIRELWHVDRLPLGAPQKALEDPMLPGKLQPHQNYNNALVRLRRVVEFWNSSSSETQAKVYIVYSSIAAWGAAFSRNSRSGLRIGSVNAPVWRLGAPGTEEGYFYHREDTPIPRVEDIRVERRNLGGFSISNFERIKGAAIGHLYRPDGNQGLLYRFVGAPYTSTPGGSLIVDYNFSLPQPMKGFVANDPQLLNSIAIPDLAAGEEWATGLSVGFVPFINVVPMRPALGQPPNLPQL